MTMYGNQLYKMLDQKSAGFTPAIPIDEVEAIEANTEGYGIFWALNQFHSSTRKIENLKSIVAWAVDIDDGEKSEQLEKIKSGPIPHLVVETKRGFQIYFRAENASPEYWNSIVLDRLVPFYGADARARDLARILRVPGYYHLKDPLQPFLVTEIWNYPGKYTQTQMAYLFPDVSKEKREEFIKSQKLENKKEFEGVWDQIWHLDHQEALERISGKEEFGGEVFSFRKASNGNLNILVNGQGTSCWLDKNLRIGSLDKGGPTIFQWVKWYGYTNSKTVEIIKKYFPELLWKK